MINELKDTLSSVKAPKQTGMTKYEVTIKVSKDTLIKRNQKKLYTDGKNVVGVDLPFDEPKHSDLVIHND